MPVSAWEIHQNEYNSQQNRKYETVFSLANGYRGLRGGLEFSSKSWRGNFIAGIFDKASAKVTELVNFQDPLLLNIYIDDESVNFDSCDFIKFKRTLKMNEGVLYGNFEVKTPHGRIIRIITERYVSKNNVHRWAACYKITPLNFSGRVIIENIIDGTTSNSSHNPENKVRHYSVQVAEDLKSGIALNAKTHDKSIEVIETSALIFEGNKSCSRRFKASAEKAIEDYEIPLEKGREVVIYKLGATYTSKDCIRNTKELCRKEILDFIIDGYESERFLHKKSWEKLWSIIDIKITGDEKAQGGIRFNLFQLVSSSYEGDEKTSIGAKGLHGEGYKGHVFWDTEVFMLPFFIYTIPEAAKSLLLYRYNTLEGARRNAKAGGYKGARFPWESADDGMEVTPKWGKDFNGNPIRIWTGEEEYHINSDIVYGILEYCRASGDDEFLLNYGLEIILDVARFWQSRVEYNTKENRYEINRVIGPDEFHEHINNNAYTNYLAKWSIKKALELILKLSSQNVQLIEYLCSLLELSEEDFKEWEAIEEKLYIPRGSDGRLIEQFEGYFNLEYVEIKEQDEKGMPLMPDLNGMELGETQLVKQPDVVMLMLLLSDEFEINDKRENYNYYEKRTMHKSSLSPSMYSIMGLATGDTHNAYRYFMKTIMTDLEDNQGNTEQGLHAASTGGSWQSAVFGFGGFRVDKNGIPCFSPWIPEHWSKMSFNIRWKNAVICITIEQGMARINSTEDIEIKFYENTYYVEKDSELSVGR